MHGGLFGPTVSVLSQGRTMNEPEYDVHPLDRDYSEPEAKPKRWPGMPDSPLHRAGVIIFSIGFVSLLVTAAILGVFRNSGWVETFGSYVHRFAMVMILVGGLLILIGIRVKSLPIRRALRRPKGIAATLAAGHGLGLLLLINVAGFLMVQGLLQVVRVSFSPQAVGFAYSTLMMVLTALMALAALIHRGIVRGYAVGFCIPVLMGTFSISAAFGYWSTRSPAIAIMQQLILVQVIGMVCATYAAFFDRPDTQRDS